MKKIILKQSTILFAALLHYTMADASVLDRYFQTQMMEQPSLKTPASIHKLTFNQLIDHHNPALGTFSERFYIDETFSQSPDDPVFFYICGEAPCTARALSGAIRTYAEQFHAKLIALEHRYYGESLPVNSLSTKNLQFLSTEAALDDLAYFQRHITHEKQWTGPWVAFGGSYPGSLSAYYRLSHPELVVGALASSAPVMAKEDFIEYDAHVTSVAGEQCANQIRQVVHDVESVLDNDVEFENLKAHFEASEVLDKVDFLYLIAEIEAASIQYGMKDAFCSALAEARTPFDGYAEYARALYKTTHITPVQMTAQGAMSEDPHDGMAIFGMRQWYYQSCQEYGYWQNAHPNPSRSTRSSLINLDYHHHICERLFGLTQPVDVNKINDQFYFPLMHESVSKIFMTNGSDDPWSTLSMTLNNGNATNNNLTYQTIEGAAHCEDLHSPLANDSASLKTARQKMIELLKKWLN